jgi:hypothetical protein
MSRLFAADAHGGDRKHFVVRADEKLTAFMELEGAIRSGIVHANRQLIRK